jgi:hypothetical protein
MPISRRSGRRRLAQPARKRVLLSPLDRAKGSDVIWPQVAPLFEAARGLVGATFVYLIGEEDGPIKIGEAKDPIRRLREMQTGNPRRMRVEYVLLGDAHTERLLHEMWESFAIVAPHKQGRRDAHPGTEWFRADAREQLLPIIATAAQLQAKAISRSADPLDREQLESLIRQAHGFHGFVAQKRDEVRLLAVGGDYASGSRPSRI